LKAKNPDIAQKDIFS